MARRMLGERLRRWGPMACLIAASVSAAGVLGWLDAASALAVSALFGAGGCYAVLRTAQKRDAAHIRMLETQAEADRAKAEVVAQRRTLDALADGLEVAIFVCDVRGTVQFANRAALDMFRFENPTGRSILAMSLSPDLEQLVFSAANGEASRSELSFSYPTERVALAQAWLDASDSSRVFVTVFDLTDLRRLERVRQDFVANVSHELRTPMTNIRAMAETLLDTSDRAVIERYLTNIVVEIDRLTSITNDLLTLSRAESTRVTKSECDFAEIARSIVRQLDEKAAAKGLRLHLAAPERLSILANASQLSQVVINLVDNAINYTPTGSVDVTLEEGEGEIVLTVRDTGLGILAEHVPRIFERFYRVDKGRSRESGGTGLGLSIVKHIVEAHGGKVEVESALNHGSTFTVTLPT